MNRIWAWGILLFLGTVWGLSFSLMKIVVSGGAHPFGVSLWQSLLGSLFLVSFTIIRRKKIPLHKQALLFYLICGLIGNAIPSVLFYTSAIKLPAGVLSLTVASVPMLTFVFSAFFGLESFKLIRIVGVLFGVLAVSMLVLPQQSLPDPSAAIWVLVAFGAPVCYATQNVIVAKRMPRNFDTYQLTCGMLIAAAMMMSGVVFLTDSFAPLHWPPGPVDFAIFGMATINAVAMGLFFLLIKHAGPLFASQVGYLVTFCGIAWGIVLFSEQHSYWIWLAVIAMLAGLAMVSPRKAQTE